MDVSAITVTEHWLNLYRKEQRVQIWKLKKALEADGIAISEGAISRFLRGIDTPMPLHVESALADILNVDMTGRYEQ